MYFFFTSMWASLLLRSPQYAQKTRPSPIVFCATILAMVFTLLVVGVDAQLPPAKKQPYEDDFISFYRKAGEPPHKFYIPKLNEEDERSLHFPRDNYLMKCDACSAISYQIEKALKEAEAMYNGEPLRESIMIDTFDKVCTAEFWDKLYGVKPWRGDGKTLRISGPGSDPRVTQQRDMRSGGSRWGLRFRSRCSVLVGDAGGEYDVYDMFREKGYGGLGRHMCLEATSDCKQACKKIDCMFLERGLGVDEDKWGNNPLDPEPTDSEEISQIKYEHRKEQFSRQWKAALTASKATIKRLAAKKKAGKKLTKDEKKELNVAKNVKKMSRKNKKKTAAKEDL